MELTQPEEAAMLLLEFSQTHKTSKECKEEQLVAFKIESFPFKKIEDFLIASLDNSTFKRLLTCGNRGRSPEFVLRA
ncbi:hypothetical protein HNY73_015388 [Argiope bruennichi]|uniref:Uncharacterized protein n=1 Tax=Argiope bruennichi TaxID=94029 RepID=A0A8T0ETC5_ARGBR|nr:hypothetical protein HNY73_015388 [Argiope bruennichi]